jgi:hypothetical protein
MTAHDAACCRSLVKMRSMCLRSMDGREELVIQEGHSRSAEKDTTAEKASHKMAEPIFRKSKKKQCKERAIVSSGNLKGTGVGPLPHHRFSRRRCRSDSSASQHSVIHHFLAQGSNETKRISNRIRRILDRL